jgi:hypothetical protein
MYEAKPGGWSDYDAQLDRMGENTQLFQVIRVDGDRLTYQAFTPTAELYDAFDLLKEDGRPNRLVERLTDSGTFRFEGTDAYAW